jgi:hypothetical protein
MLCAAIGAWAQRRGERVEVIFDGPTPPNGLARQLAHAAIEVSYGDGASADARLIQRLETDSAARRLLVVSSDHEVVRAARRRRARTIGSAEFWALLEWEAARAHAGPPGPATARPSSRSEPVEKKQGLAPEATRQWLVEFGFEPPENGPSEGRQAGQPSDKQPGRPP